MLCSKAQKAKICQKFMKNIIVIKNNTKLNFSYCEIRGTIIFNNGEAKANKNDNKIDMKSFVKTKNENNKFMIHNNQQMKIIYLPGCVKNWQQTSYPFESVDFYPFQFCDIIKQLFVLSVVGNLTFIKKLDPKHFSHYPSFHYSLFYVSGRIFVAFFPSLDFSDFTL